MSKTGKTDKNPYPHGEHSTVQAEESKYLLKATAC